MTNNFEEYKKLQDIKKAYKQASDIQEGFALGACVVNDKYKQYEGYLAVNDVLTKIDAMVRMFEKCIQDDSYKESGDKIISIIENLYDLAQIKLSEAKKQSSEYMKKATGTFSQVPDPDISEPHDIENEEDEDNEE